MKMDKKKFVEQDLAAFLQLHSVKIESEPDDVVISYIMEEIDIVINGGGDTMDVEEFIEIMTAYIPELVSVERERVTEWLFEVVVRLRESEAALNTTAEDLPKAASGKDSATAVLLSNSDSCSVCTQCKCHAVSETAEEVDEDVEALLSMFPSLTVQDAEDFLGLAGGNLQSAADLVLESPHPNNIGRKLRERSSSEGERRDEERRKAADSTQHRCASESHTGNRCSSCRCQCHTTRQPTTARASAPAIAGDLKQKIIERYSLVPDAGDSETKEHRPFLPSEQPKKMTRYLDGRIVSTKGETRIDIKQPESADMKKTYINLKPARKYKFH